jgi:hypothetical protein
MAVGRRGASRSAVARAPVVAITGPDFERLPPRSRLITLRQRNPGQLAFAAN